MNKDFYFAISWYDKAHPFSAVKKNKLNKKHFYVTCYVHGTVRHVDILILCCYTSMLYISSSWSFDIWWWN